MSWAGSSSICLTNKSLVSDGDEMIQSVNDEVNIAKDGCISLLMTWLIGMLVDPVTVNNGPFDKSYCHFSGGQPVRYCSQKHFVGTEANGEKYERERVVIVFAINRIISHILLQEKGSVTGEFYHHEKKTLLTETLC